MQQISRKHDPLPPLLLLLAYGMQTRAYGPVGEYLALPAVREN